MDEEGVWKDLILTAGRIDKCSIRVGFTEDVSMNLLTDLRIQCRQTIIKDNYLGLRVEGSSQGNSSSLATTEAGSLHCHWRINAIWKSLKITIQTTISDNLLQLVLVQLAAKKDIFLDCSIEQDWFLWHVGQCALQIGNIIVFALI